MLDGVKTDAHRHAETLGGDEFDRYDLNDLPAGRPITDADIDRARELDRQRRRSIRSSETKTP